MRPVRPLTSSIGLDFIDAYGDRLTSYQLVEVRDGKRTAVALLDFENGELKRLMTVRGLIGKRKPLERLARRVMAKSIPQTFGKQLDDNRKNAKEIH